MRLVERNYDRDGETGGTR